MKKDKKSSEVPMRTLGQDAGASADIFGKGSAPAKQPEPSPAMKSGLLGQKCVDDGQLK